MTSDELVETITRATQQQGIARIPVSAILEAFPPDQQAESFGIHDELQTFAESHGWTFQRENPDFMVFYPLGSESPQTKKEGSGK